MWQKTGSSALPSSVRMYSRPWLGPWPCEGSAGSVENCRAGRQKRRAGSLGCMVSCRSRVEVLVFRKASAVSDVFQLVEPHPPQSNCVTSGTHQLTRDLSIMWIRPTRQHLTLAFDWDIGDYSQAMLTDQKLPSIQPFSFLIFIHEAKSFDPGQTPGERVKQGKAPRSRGLWRLATRLT